jgi:hypothetical protein
VLTLDAIERDLEAVESQIAGLLKTKDTLIQMRHLALQLGARQTSIEKPPHDPKRLRERPQPEKYGTRPRSKRDTMRAITIQMDGTFTLHDLKSATERSSFPLASTLTTQDWSACLYTFYRQGLLEMVEDRRGNLPAVYRLKTKDLAPPPSGKVSEFPLQEMVMRAIAAMTEPQFGRKEIFAKVVEMNPEHTARITIQSVSAVLNRISRLEKSPVKTTASGFGGNIYTLVAKPS